MQVFKIEPRAPYTYGAAIVAARDSEEAIKTYCATEFRNEDGINEYISGTICSVEHKIDKDNKFFDYKLNIKVY